MKQGLTGKDFLYQMERHDFLNIEVLLDKPTRLAHIRPTKDRIFQKSAVIVMDCNYLSGYTLKERFNMNADEGRKVLVTLPKQKEKDFDLSGVTLKPKYPEERIIDPNKLKDLEELTNFIGDPNDKQWIYDLKERQIQLKQTYEPSAEFVNEQSEGLVDAQCDEDIDKLSEDQVDAENDSDYVPINPGPSTSRKKINLRKRKIQTVHDSENLDRIMEREAVIRKPSENL